MGLAGMLVEIERLKGKEEFPFRDVCESYLVKE